MRKIHYWTETSIRNEQAREAWCAAIRPHWRRLAREVLEPREAVVLKLRSGLDSNVALTQSLIARRLGCTTETVRKLEQSARAKVRAALNREGSK